MKTIILIFSSLLLAVSTKSLEVFKINLDEPPQLRFVEPTLKYATQLLTLVEWYEKNIPMPLQF